MSDDSNQSDVNQMFTATSSKGMPQISERDKKKDILAAYQQLVKKFTDKASQSKQKEKEIKREKETEMVKKITGCTVESILQGVNALEKNIRNFLDDISSELIKETEKLNEIQEAIKIEKNNLDEVHKIQVQAETFSDLIESYEIKKKEFEEKMRIEEEAFEKEVNQKREEWKREQEEYEYQIKQNRKRDEDIYKVRKDSLEKELHEREKVIKEQEEEFKDLKVRAEMFDEELGTTIEETKEEITNNVKQEEKVKADLYRVTVSKEKELSDFKIQALEYKVEEQKSETDDLKLQLVETNRSAKELAEKLIQAVSGAESLQNLKKIVMEQARNKGDNRDDLKF